jgi:GT2 family glycosyltransferase
MEPINTYVIPHYKNYPGVLRCLKTLHERTPDNFRVILVDQGEKDLWKEVKPYVHLYLKSYRQLGFSKACNEGWRIADTPYVTLLNDDVEFIDPRWWEGVMESFRQNVVGVNPKTARAYTLGTKIEDRLPYKEEWSEADYNDMLKLPYDSLQCQAMFCTVFKQDIAAKIGLFDEFFYPSGGEDTDWIARAGGLLEDQNHFRGYEVISTPKSYVWHWWNQSAVDTTFTKARIQLREKWGSDYDMNNATMRRLIPKSQVRPL